MPNPNPEAFAKVVLWHVTGARADFSALEQQVEALRCGLPGKTAGEIQALKKSEHHRLFLQAVEQAGLGSGYDPMTDARPDPDDPP